LYLLEKVRAVYGAMEVNDQRSVWASTVICRLTLKKNISQLNNHELQWRKALIPCPRELPRSVTLSDKIQQVCAKHQVFLSPSIWFTKRTFSLRSVCLHSIRSFLRCFLYYVLGKLKFHSGLKLVLLTERTAEKKFRRQAFFDSSVLTTFLQVLLFVNTV